MSGMAKGGGMFSGMKNMFGGMGKNNPLKAMGDLPADLPAGVGGMMPVTAEDRKKLKKDKKDKKAKRKRSRKRWVYSCILRG